MTFSIILVVALSRSSCLKLNTILVFFQNGFNSWMFSKYYLCSVDTYSVNITLQHLLNQLCCMIHLLANIQKWFIHKNWHSWYRTNNSIHNNLWPKLGRTTFATTVCGLLYWQYWWYLSQFFVQKLVNQKMWDKPFSFSQYMGHLSCDVADTTYHKTKRENWCLITYMMFQLTNYWPKWYWFQKHQK